MNWNKLTTDEQLNHITAESADKAVVVFKHSTRCSISNAALNRLERNWNEQETNGIVPYYLDLLQYRQLSNQIATQWNIEHQSPQLLLIKNGQCVYHASHFDIEFDELKKALSSLN